MSKDAHVKLTDAERTTIVNALTLAATQYETDAERASEFGAARHDHFSARERSR